MIRETNLGQYFYSKTIGDDIDLSEYDKPESSFSTTEAEARTRDADVIACQGRDKYRNHRQAKIKACMCDCKTGTIWRNNI